MAPINQYTNMLTGFLDKKFIPSPANVDSLSCFIHDRACLALSKLFHCQKLQVGQGTLPIFLFFKFFFFFGHFSSHSFYF